MLLYQILCAFFAFAIMQTGPAPLRLGPSDSDSLSESDSGTPPRRHGGGAAAMLYSFAQVNGLETFPIDSGPGTGITGWTYYDEDPDGVTRSDESKPLCVASDPSNSSVVLSGTTVAASHSGNIYDIFALKLDSSGAEMWRYQTGTSTYDFAYGVAIDQSDSSIVLTGFTLGGLIGSNAGSNDIFAIKLNSSGSELWRYQTGTSSNDYAVSVAIDQSDSSIVLTGYTEGSLIGTNAGDNDIFAIKLNSSGSEVWRYQTGTSSNDYARGVAIDHSDSSIVLIGYTFGSLAGSNAGNTDMFAIKLNSSGSDVWRYQAGTTTIDYAFGVAVDQSNSAIVLTGYTFGSLIGSNAGIIDIVAIKLDSSGSEVWRYQSGTSSSDYVQDVAIDQSDSSIVLTGYTQGVLIGSKAGINDIFAIKLDSSGSEEWRYQTGTPSNDLAYAVAIDESDSSVLVAGRAADSAFVIKRSNNTVLDTIAIDSSVSQSTSGAWDANLQVNHTFHSPFMFYAQVCIMAIPRIEDSGSEPGSDDIQADSIRSSTYPAVHECVEHVVNTTNSTSYVSFVQLSLPSSWLNTIFNVYAASFFNGAPTRIHRLPSLRTPRLDILPAVTVPDWNYALSDIRNYGLVAESGSVAYCNADSSVVIVGTTRFEVAAPTADGQDIFAVKLDSFGAEIWRYQTGTSSTDAALYVAIDESDSSIVMTGYTYGALTGSNAGSNDIFAIKLNSAGSEVWRYQTGTSSNDYAYGVAIDQSDSSIVLTGYTEGSLIGMNAGNSDIFAIKLDSSGSEIWRYQTGTSSNDYARDIAIDHSDSSIVLTGGTLGALTGLNAGDDDIFAIKLHSSGSDVWRYQVGTSSTDYAYGVAVDESDSSVILVGSTRGLLTGSTSGSSDIFAIKLNSSGSEVWRYQAGTSSSDYVQDAAIDQSDSSIVLTGYTTGSFIGWNAGNNDIFAIKLDSAGTEEWRRQTGTSSDDYAYGVTIDKSDSSVLVAGRAADSAFVIKRSNNTVLDAIAIDSSVSQSTSGAWDANLQVNHTFHSPFMFYAQVCIMAIPRIEDSGSEPGSDDIHADSIRSSTYPAVHGCVEYVVNTTNSTSYVSFVQLSLPSSWSNTIFNVYAASFFNGAPTRIHRLPSLRTPRLDILPAANLPDWNYAMTNIRDSGGNVAQSFGIAYCNADSSMVMAGSTNFDVAAPAAGKYDMFAVKLDSFGAEIWRYQIGASTNEYLRGVAIDQSDCSIVLAGHTYFGSVFGPNAGFDDIIVAKLDSSGSQVWQYQTGTSSYDYAYGVAIDQSDSSIVLTGYTYGSLIGSHAGNSDIFAIKFNTSGSEVWRYQTGTSSYDYAYGIAIDPSDSSIVLAGYSRGSLAASNAGNADVVVIKLDSSGSQVWQYQIGTTSFESAYSVAIDKSDSSVVVTGSTQGSLGGSNAGFLDMFAIKLDSSGSELWRYQVGDSSEDAGYGVAVDPSDSSIVLAGKTSLQSSSGTISGIYAVKLSSSSSQLWEFTADYASATIARSVVIDLAGNVFISGEASATIGDTLKYAAVALKFANNNNLQSNSSIAQVSAVDVSYCNATISVSSNLYFSRMSKFTICVVAVPTLYAQSASILNASSLSIIDGYNALQLQLPPYSSRSCSSGLDNSGEIVASIRIEGLLVNTAYTVVAAHSLINATKVEHNLFVTRKAESTFGSSLQIATPLISLAQPHLTLSLPITMLGNPSNVSVSTETYGFNPSTSAPTVTIPVNQDGSQLSTVMQLPGMTLNRDPLRTLPLGDHQIIVTVDIDDTDTQDTVFNIDIPKNYTTSVQVRGTLLVTQNGSDASSLAVSTFGDTDATIELEIFPAPPTPVTVTFVTLGGSPSLSYFVNASNSLMPSALFRASRTDSLVHQQWSLTQDAYPAALIAKPVLEGVNVSLVTDVPSEVSIHIRSAIECRATRVATSAPLSLLQLYIDEDSSFVTEILLQCRSVLRFVTDNTRVFVSVNAPPELQVSPDTLEIKLGQESVAFSVSTSSTSVQQLSFDVSTESVQLDPSFFPLNPDGYTLSIQGVPRNTHNVTIPTRAIVVDGNDWSGWQTVSISDPPLYSLVVQLVATNGTASLEFEPPNGRLLFTPESATTLQFRCRAKAGAHVGMHHIGYDISGSDWPGYSITGSDSGSGSGTSVAVHGTISIEPPLRILYGNLPSSVFSVALSGTPVDDTITIQLVASRQTQTEDSTSIAIDPSVFVFGPNSALSLPITSVQAEENPSNGVFNVTVTAMITTPSRWYANQSWLVQVADVSSLGAYFFNGFSHTLATSGADVNRTVAFVESLILPSSATTQSTVVVAHVALSSTSALHVAYGIAATNSWTACESATITRNTTAALHQNLPVYSVRCTVPAGAGANYSIAILYNKGQAILAVSTATFSFPAPTLRSGTLRNVESGLGESRLFAPSVSASDTVYFEGTGFGLSSDRINVTFGPTSNPLLFKCALITLTDTLCGCQLIGGRGINLVFHVDVGGQAVIGTDTYSYPNAPSITRIQGCGSGSHTSSLLQQCPTLGSVVLTVWGTFFSDSKEAMQIQVGGDQCDIQSISLGGVALEDKLTCILPAGSGAGRSLQISRVFADVTLTSSVTGATPRISYAEPEILSISSPNCTSVSPTVSVDCPRQVATLSNNSSLDSDSSLSLITANVNTFHLVVTGRHFGNATVVVVVGSTLCQNPRIEVIDESSDSQRITCELPLAQETDQSVLILVPNGATNQGSPASLSFLQCPAGTFEDRTTQRCITCSRYEYQQSPGKPQCDSCATNQYKSSPDPSQALCALCPSGATCGQRLPVQNQVGYWLSPQLAGDVLSYKCVQGRCIAASSCFPSTSAMISTGFASVSCCSEGRVSAHNNPLCGICTTGYSEWNGTCIPCESTNYGLIAAYVVLGYMILFGVYHITSSTSGAKLKVLVLFGQTIHAFVASDPTFPSIFGAVASLDPVGSSSSCVTPITGLGQASLPIIQLMALYVLLLSLVLINKIAWFIHRHICFRPGPDNGSVIAGEFPSFKFSAFRRVAIALITMSFIPIFKATVLLGKCTDVISATGENLNLLEQYPSVDCSSSDYTIVFALSVTVSTAIAILVSSFVVMYGQHRYRMYADLCKAQSHSKPAAAAAVTHADSVSGYGSDNVSSRNDRRMSLHACDEESKSLKKFIEARYGFLFRAFRTTTKWTASWQAVLMLRSGCLVLVSALVDDWQTRFSFLVLLAGVFLAVHIHVLPYHYSTWDNQLETAALSTLACFGVLNSMEWYHGDTIRALSILMYYGFLVSWLIVYIYLYWKAGKCQRWRSRCERSMRHDDINEPPGDRHGGDAAAQYRGKQEAMVALQWSWWQYLFCWYLAPRNRYVDQVYHDGHHRRHQLQQSEWNGPGDVIEANTTRSSAEPTNDGVAIRMIPLRQISSHGEYHDENDDNAVVVVGGGGAGSSANEAGTGAAWNNAAATAGSPLAGPGRLLHHSSSFEDIVQEPSMSAPSAPAPGPAAAAAVAFESGHA
jgi:hypothetical protein